MSVKGKQLKTNSVNKEQTITVGGKEYKLTLDFNVMAELEEIYGDFNLALNDILNMKIKAIRAFIYAIIKAEDEDEDLTIKKVGKMLDMNFITDFLNKMGEVLKNDMPEKTEEMKHDELGELKPTLVE